MLVFARNSTKCGNKGKCGRQVALHSRMVGRCASLRRPWSPPKMITLEGLRVGDVPRKTARTMIEYVLLRDVNDSDREATQLGQLLQSRARKA